MTAAAALLLSAGASRASAPLIAADALQPFTVAQAWNGLAPCLSEPSATDWASEPAIAEPVDAQVAGFQLRAQAPRLVQALAQIAKAAPAGPRDPACNDVLCAAAALFGPGLGPQLLHLAATYGFDATGLAAASAPGEAQDRLDQVIAAFGDLPAGLFQAGAGGFRVVTAQRGRVEARVGMGLVQGEVIAEAGEGAPGIILHEGWGELGANARRAAVLHEIAHEFIRLRGHELKWRRAWRRATAADMAAATGDRASAFVSVYARTSLDEDFAESFVAYRYRAPALKRRAPRRYALLQQWVFGGVEYGSAQGCRVTPSVV